MKKILFASAIILGFYSCGGNDSTESGEELTPLTVEQGKQELEDNSLAFLTEIDNYKNDDALTEIKEIADVLLLETESKSVASKNFNNLIDLQSGKKDIISFNSSTFNDVSLIDDYNAETGIYEWNKSTEEFDKTGDSNNIIYKVSYNNKNAEFIVSNFKTTTFTTDNEEVPTSLKSSLKIDGKEIFSQTYSASVDNGKYLPNSVTNSVKLGELTIATKLINESNKTLKFETSFSIGKTSLMSYYVAASGNFNEIDTKGDNISEDTKIEDILDSSEFSMSFLNAKITGKVTEPSTIPEDDISTEEAVNLLNENVLIDITVNNKSVAKGEFYIDEYEDGYYDWNGNYIEETYTDPNLRLLFSDGTTADFDTYFGQGFSSVEGKFDDVIDSYTAKFE